MIKIQQFTCSLFGENTYLLYDDTKEAVLIDCGCMKEKEEKNLSDFLVKNELTLKRLLSTHSHFDHVIGNAFIYRNYNIRPEMHRNERDNNIPTLDMQAKAFGISKTFEDIEPGRYIEDNEEISFGHSVLQALLVPGHSPGSLAFYSRKENIVFTGDALFYGSIGRTDLWGGDHETLINSIKKKLLVLPDETKIYPGHGPAGTISHEKKSNPYLL